MKATLALEHGILPRSLHGETPNPDIPFDRLNLRLAGAAEPIAPDDLRRGQFLRLWRQQCARDPRRAAAQATSRCRGGRGTRRR